MSREPIKDVGLEAIRGAGSAEKHCPVSVVVEDGYCVHVVERIRVVASVQDLSRINGVEILDRGASDMVVLVLNLAHCHVDVGIRKSKLA